MTKNIIETLGIEDTHILTIKSNKGKIWYQAAGLANVLGYNNIRQILIDNINSDNKHI